MYIMPIEPKKAIYLHVPESEYVRFKVFASLHQISMQRLIRRAVKELIERNKIIRTDC